MTINPHWSSERDELRAAAVARLRANFRRGAFTGTRAYRATLALIARPPARNCELPFQRHGRQP